MQAPRFLHKMLASSLPVIHAKRLQALLDAVGALLSGHRLGLTALGRTLPGTAFPKHAIKRMDRLLGNSHLHQERPLFYWLIARLLLGNTMRPVIVVDWSPVDDRGRHFLLRAAVPFAGRSFPIFEKIHHKEGCPHCEAYLLEALAEILPETATPMPASEIRGSGPSRHAAGAMSGGSAVRLAIRRNRRGSLSPRASSRPPQSRGRLAGYRSPKATRWLLAWCSIIIQRRGVSISISAIGSPRTVAAGRLPDARKSLGYWSAIWRIAQRWRTRWCVSTVSACRSRRAFAISKVPCSGWASACINPGKAGVSRSCC